MLPKYKNHMVQKILRREIEEQRRKSVLLENDRRAHRSLQTVRLVSFDELAKRTHRAPTSFPVVRHLTQKSLHFPRCIEPLDEFPLGRAEAFLVRNHHESVDFVRQSNKNLNLHLLDSTANVRLVSH